ncbi:MAG: hypothetical protein J3Q66DRAFT_161583 [Benniella sp.]|nr:MAG: hypothetical protein J3Q66DRAFT_161583 [Benniella sp.]
MSNDRSEEPEEDLVQLVREPLSPMASFHPFQLESSRDTAVTKSKGTPIDVPKAAPRLSTFSSPNTTLRTGLPSSSGSRRKSSVSLQGGRASPPFGSKEGFDVVGQIPQLSRTQNERSKVKREHFNFLSDDEDQKDSKIPKRRNTGYQSTSLPMKATGTSPSSPLAGSSAYYVSRMRKHASPAESACATQSTSSVSSTSLAASSVTLKRGTSSSTLAALNRLKRPIIESNRIRYSSDLSTSSRQKPSSLMHASSSERASVSDSVRPPVHRRPFLFEHTSLPDKVSALGMGTFPQASLSCVLLGDMHEFRNSGMAIQFGPDRFILNIDKNVTKIPHDNIRRIEVH